MSTEIINSSNGAILNLRNIQISNVGDDASLALGNIEISDSLTISTLELGKTSTYNNASLTTPNPSKMQLGMNDTSLTSVALPTAQVGSTNYGYHVCTLTYTTPNATPVDLNLVELDFGTSCTIEVIVNSADIFGSGLYTGGNGVGGFYSAGTAVVKGTDYNKLGIGDFEFSVSGSMVSLTVTGIIATSIVWSITAKILYNICGP